MCASLEEAARAVKTAFEAVGRCEDEFLPDYPEACGEWRDALDLAIVRLITALSDRGWLRAQEAAAESAA
jgi:hypothetical protein